MPQPDGRKEVSGKLTDTGVERLIHHLRSNESVLIMDPLWLVVDDTHPYRRLCDLKCLKLHTKVIIPSLFKIAQHWVLFVVDFPSRKLLFYDSLPNPTRIQKAKEVGGTLLQGLDVREVTFEVMPGPVQLDGDSCGYFVVAAIHAVVQGTVLSPTIKADDLRVEYSRIPSEQLVLSMDGRRDESDPMDSFDESATSAQAVGNDILMDKNKPDTALLLPGDHASTKLNVSPPNQETNISGCKWLSSEFGTKEDKTTIGEQLPILGDSPTANMPHRPMGLCLVDDRETGTPSNQRNRRFIKDCTARIEPLTRAIDQESNKRKQVQTASVPIPSAEEHVLALKKRGVIFESDDSSSEEIDVPPPKPSSHAPLTIRPFSYLPKTSKNLFEVAPQYRPENMLQTANDESMRFFEEKRKEIRGRARRKKTFRRVLCGSKRCNAADKSEKVRDPHKNIERRVENRPFTMTRKVNSDSESDSNSEYISDSDNARPHQNGRAPAGKRRSRLVDPREP